MPLSERAQRYTTFVTPFGMFSLTVLSFGLKNAPFCFSSLMSKVLRGLEVCAIPYLDNAVVLSDDWDEHLVQLRNVLSRLQSAGLTVKPESVNLVKCKSASSTMSSETAFVSPPR